MQKIKICKLQKRHGKFERNFKTIGKLPTDGPKRRASGWKHQNRRNYVQRIILNTTIRQKLENDHVTCRSPQTISNTIQFLLDSGSDLNLIKLSALKDDVLVHDKIIYQLKGITDQCVQTLGSVQIEVQIGNDTRRTEFHVVHASFPIPHEGILGKPFIVGNEAIINYQTKELILTDPSEITLQPRTETLVAIQAPDKTEHSEILIEHQELAESIACSNCVTTVRNKAVLVTLINPTEMELQIQLPNLNQLNHEEYIEATIGTTQISNQLAKQADSSRLTKLQEALRTEHLNTEEKSSLFTICNLYSDLFFLEGDKITATTAVAHEIRTPEAVRPIHDKPYRLPARHRQEISDQMEILERDGVIAPSDSPWNAPLLVVPKKPDINGRVKYRVCVDFRRLNQITIGDAFPLPNITDILDQLGKSKYYSTLDLAQGYHQVPMNQVDREKTAFSTDKGHYEFLRMPFGLKGAPGTFQRLMNKVLSGLNGLKAFVYLDDIIIYAKDLTDHSQKLIDIFDRLRKYNLKLQPIKCEFLRKEVTYLGHRITDEGVKPDPQKVECVQKFPVPKNVKEIKSFLGLSGYYRKFIQSYGQIAKPLTSLLKKDVPFEWNDLCQEAFETLKSCLTKAPILQYPDFSQPFNLTCDASNYAIGCVLSQGVIGKDLPVAYASRTLNKAEINYNTTEKELTSIVWGIKVFRPYLFGQQFNIITDHRALLWLFNLKDPGSRLTRWRLKLEEYQYTIHYKSGTSNTNADALSRIHRVVTRSHSQTENSNQPTTSQSENTEHSEPPETSASQQLTNNTEPSELLATTESYEYKQFLSAEPSFKKPNTNLIEVQGDLFDEISTVSLVHCVSADFKMTKGIALTIRRKFGNVKQLRKLNKRVTEVATLTVENRTIFYLITKQYHWQKPVYQHLFQSLLNLKKICEERHITQLVCPRLGCGLDGLKWENVRPMICYIFRNSSINIKIIDREPLTADEQQRVIKEFHENPLGGHQGIARTYQRISQQYHWKGMRQMIKNYILSCATCQLNKTTNRTIKEPMVITTTASRPFEKIFMDIVGPLPKSYNGNVFILTLQDDLSKFAWAAPMVNHEASTVAFHFVTQFVCLHGLPQNLVTDCGTEFLSKVFKETCQLLKIKQTSTTPYHPQSNGSLERSHRTLGEYLRNFVNKDPQNWDSYVPYAMFCHNSTVHTATNFQPYQLVYGHEIKVPNSFVRDPEPQYNYNDYYSEMKRNMQEAHQLAKRQLQDSKLKAKERYDKSTNPLNISIGERVMMQEKTSKGKLAPKWLGPFTVIGIQSDSPNITILRKNKPTTLHRNLLKPFVERN